MFTQDEAQIRLYFWWSVILKGAISLAEVIGGLVLLLVPPAFFVGYFMTLIQRELAEEPGDFIASHALPITQGMAVTSGTFIAIYLLSRGLIKLLLVFALLKNQLWAYPASLVVLGLFIAYQCYEIAIGHSAIIIVVTIFDLIVIYFIWREWGVLKQHPHMRASL